MRRRPSDLQQAAPQQAAAGRSLDPGGRQPGRRQGGTAGAGRRRRLDHDQQEAARGRCPEADSGTAAEGTDVWVRRSFGLRQFGAPASGGRRRTGGPTSEAPTPRQVGRGSICSRRLDQDQQPGVLDWLWGLAEPQREIFCVLRNLGIGNLGVGLKMKRKFDGQGVIASLFRKHEAKAKNIAMDKVGQGDIDNMVEDENQEQESEMIEKLIEEQEPSLIEQEKVYDIDLLPHDPGKRMPIASYHVNDQDAVRRAYILKGPCQPYAYDFPTRNIGGRDRHFSFIWFHRYSSWLEYSIEKDAVFCLICYLFKDKTKGGDSFVKNGWRNWNKNDALDKHVGSITSIHKKAQEKFDLFTRKPNTSIDNVILNVSKEDLRMYTARLTYSFKCLRFLLHQGLPCRGHDESEESNNRGNFLELLKWLASSNEEIDKVVLKNAPRNCKLTCADIQKDTIQSCAKETMRHLFEEFGDDHYAILADESSDVSHKEQLALCLRYVDKLGRVCERFLRVVHVAGTTSLSLKEAIKSLLIEHRLIVTQIRGQGYDGASNMKGEINGLKTLIMKESPSAYYVHCFAHQLQLVLIAVAKDSDACVWFFDQVSYLLNIIGSSCKRHDMLRNVRARKVLEALKLGEIESGHGLNQEIGLARPGDTRWGSHYRTILHIIGMYSTIHEVLITIGEDRSQRHDWTKVHAMVLAFESFDFVFNAHLMLLILGYTNELSQSLQKGDQDIINAMSLVSMAKSRMQHLRSHGWEVFIGKVTSFYNEYGIQVPTSWDDMYVPHGRSSRFYPKQSNDDHFRREVYLGVIDQISQELESRFDEVNMELLVCMSALNPFNSFASFDVQKLLRLAKFYPNNISNIDLIRLEIQLENFIDDMRRDDRFKNINSLGELSIKFVETQKHMLYDLGYLLLKLVLILPVATASVERVFSAMCLVKTKLRNSMGDKFLNNCMVTFIERDIFSKVSDDEIIGTFMAMRKRKVE